MVQNFIKLISTAALVVFSPLYADDSEIVTHVSKTYSKNKVLNNEIQAIPGDARWNDQGTPGVENGILQGNSYWATVSQDKMNGEYVVQAILGITAKGESITGGVLIPFTHIENNKALPPLLKCTDCTGRYENKPIIGLPILSASLNKAKQYSGTIFDPLSDTTYKLVMWVNKAGTKIEGEGKYLFFNTSQTWYRVDNDLAEKCYDWGKSQISGSTKNNKGSLLVIPASNAETVSDNIIQKNLAKYCQ